MALMRAWVAAVLLGLAMFATGVHQARATDADPSIWGVYAQLVGTGWKGEFGTRATRWGEGNQMIEDDSYTGQSVITPGPTAGTLTLKLGSTGLHTFQGTIASDGSVLWIRDGMLKVPYRVLLRDGELVEEAVKLSGREVASVKGEIRYQQVDGPRLASRSTPTPIPGPTSPAPVRNVSTAGGAAANSMAVVPSSPALPIGPQSAQLQDGEAKTPTLRPSVASFGPYALLPGRAVVFSGGEVMRWHALDGGLGVGSELRGPDGQLQRMEVIKVASPGSLMMLRSSGCPSDVCGQTGTLKDGVVEWREPKASGGLTGGYMSVKTWVEGNELVTFTIDPAPLSGIQIYDQFPELEYLRPVPQRMKLVTSPPLTNAQYAESDAKIEALALLVESRVVQDLQGQRSRAQAISDANEARQRSSERVRSFNRAMEGIGGALRDASANLGTYAESQANLDAAVANIQNAAAVERQQQALAQQQAQARAAEENRQKLAENARWVAEKEQAAAEYRSGQVDAAAAREKQLVAQQQANEQRRAAAKPSRIVPAVAAAQNQQMKQPAVNSATGKPAGGGSLTVASVPKTSRPAPPAQNAKTGEEFMFCQKVKSSGFEGHNGALFFSAISNVVIRYREIQPASANFDADLKAAYGVHGGSFCVSDKDRAALERLLQDRLNVPSYRAYKKVMTGIQPRN